MFSRQMSEFAVLLKETAEQWLLESMEDTGEFFNLEMLAKVAL